MPFIAIALLLAAALGGGTAAAAQASLPGDALWGFKVHVNEALGGALSQPGEQKANWDIAAIQTRLAEAQTLAAKGTLTAGEQANINANLAGHAQAVADSVNKLRAQGDTADAADIAARYQATMAAGVGPLAEAQASAAVGASASLTPLVTEVHAALDAATALSAQTNLAATASAGDTTTVTGL